MFFIFYSKYFRQVTESLFELLKKQKLLDFFKIDDVVFIHTTQYDKANDLWDKIQESVGKYEVEGVLAEISEDNMQGYINKKLWKWLKEKKQLNMQIKNKDNNNE